ncbi:MAG: nucleoside monophosphate kinase [Alphaproteobacteria bacterium]|nr:nucleoside monophosphate kinase [Alphaproteobacteria bacterium]
MENLKSKIIVLMGGQGAGKGTHAKNLVAQKGFKYIEVGAILRDLPAESPMKQIMARGELVPSSELFKIISAAIDSNGKSDMILDGFPRNVEQAQWLVQQYVYDESPYDLHVLHLSLPENVMLERIANRVKEGGGRADDTDVAVVKKRLECFKRETIPAIEFLENVKGIHFYTVDVSSKDFATNFTNVCKALGIDDIDINKVQVNVAKL